MKKSFSWGQVLLLSLWFVALLACVLWFLRSGKSLSEVFVYCRELIRHAGSKAVLVFIVLSWIRGFLFIPSWLFLTMAGLTFGLFHGGLIMFIADLGSSVWEFLFIRYVARDFLGIHKKPILARYNEHLQKKGIATVIFLRLIPIFHFDILNFALGISAVNFADYFIGTFVGVIPGIIAFVLLGAGVEQISYAITGLIMVIILAILGWKYGKK